MNAMRRKLNIVAILGTVAMLMILSGCAPSIGTPPAAESLLGTSVQTDAACVTCDQATLAFVQTQQKRNSNNQAAATAHIVSTNAQATLNSANATVEAAQTQDQNNANVIAAQIAATAKIDRANAQATLSSAGATQSAALTEDAVHQTQTADMATSAAAATLKQQNSDQIAAGTQTAAANIIATQSEDAAATSQSYTDQTRQRDAQRQGPITFLWIWCLPVFILLVAGLMLWGFWRWLKIKQTNQRILLIPVEKLQAPKVKTIHQPQEDASQDSRSDEIDSHYEITKPDDQVGRWLDEVKHKLLSGDKKDEDEHPDD